MLAGKPSARSWPAILKVAMVSMTGSVAAGRKSHAAAKNITQRRFEFGGKSAGYIVMDDADVELAGEGGGGLRVRSTPAGCNCVERVYVQK